jgi:hypothetical protein
MWISTIQGPNIGPSDGVNGYSICYDNSHIYVTGNMQGSVNFYNSNNTTFKTITCFRGAFIAKLDLTGVFQWVSYVNSIDGSVTGIDICSDKNGSIYVCGIAYGQIQFFNYDNVQYGSTYSTMTTNFNNAPNFEHSKDCFVVKINDTGLIQWISKIVTNSIDYSHSLCCDNLGNVYVAGRYEKSSSAGFNPSVDYTLLGYVIQSNDELYDLPYGPNAILIKYNSSGIVQYTTKIQSDGSTPYNQSVAADDSGIYIIGTGHTKTYFYNSDNKISKIINSPNPPKAHKRGYIVKYNFDGFIQWISLLENNKIWYETSNPSTFLYFIYRNIISDNQGHLYLSNYGTRIDKFFNTNGTEFTNPLTSSSDNDTIGYLAKLSLSRFPTLAFFNIVVQKIL